MATISRTHQFSDVSFVMCADTLACAISYVAVIFPFSIFNLPPNMALTSLLMEDISVLHP
ncbi:hypothetical protein EDD22DRAFT_954202 [Suillus occidentalis]|nr:hypothetical protein EDD22DRAFT_954202 [Suillus occidentalis]